jgi:hypothetical protein
MLMNPAVSGGEKSPISSIERSLASYSFSVSDHLPITLKEPLYARHLTDPFTFCRDAVILHYVEIHIKWGVSLN